MKVFVHTSIFVDCLRSNRLLPKNFLRAWKKNITALPLNDCLIAATALSSGIKEIVTRNVEHFNKIKGLNAVTPECLGF